MCTVSPATTVGAMTVSSGGVTCHSGFNVPCAAPPAFTSAVDDEGRPVGVEVEAREAPSLPLALNAVPLGARPTTSALSPAVSRRGVSLARDVAVTADRLGRRPAAARPSP